MNSIKSRSKKLWESIEQKHIKLFEQCQKRFDEVQDAGSKEINQRFEENRKKFEDAVVEIRFITKRLDSAELKWNEERQLMEDRVNADRNATDARLSAQHAEAAARLEAERIASNKKLEEERIASDKRLEADRIASDARLAADRAKWEQDFDKRSREFASHKRWLIANFVAILLGVFAIFARLNGYFPFL